MNNCKKNSLRNIIYIRKILYSMICKNHIVNCTHLLYYNKIVSCNRIIALYCTILTNFMFNSTQLE